MARADLLLKLVRASRQGDDEQVRKVVEAVAAEERTKNHKVLAERLLAQLQINNGRNRQMSPHAPPALAGPLLAETVDLSRQACSTIPKTDRPQEMARSWFARCHR